MIALRKRVRKIQSRHYGNENDESQVEGGGIEGQSSPPDKEKNPRVKRANNKTKGVNKVNRAKKPRVEKTIGDKVEKSSG